MIEATEIMPRCWVGSLPPVGGVVASAGFHTLVFCALSSEYRLAYKLKPGENMGSRFPGVRHFISVGLDDSDRPLNSGELLRARTAAAEIASAVRSQRKVLVTCMQGRNRSALVAALALQDLCNWSGRQAMARIRMRRHVLGGMLTNPHFALYLEGMPAPSVMRPKCLPTPHTGIAQQRPQLRLVRTEER